MESCKPPNRVGDTLPTPAIQRHLSFGGGVFGGGDRRRSRESAAASQVWHFLPADLANQTAGERLHVFKGTMKMARRQALRASPRLPPLSAHSNSRPVSDRSVSYNMQV